jgi:hypothetical protein
MLFPYTLPLGVHLYTDAIGVFLVVAGTLFLSRGRAAPAFVAFALAIATRQYLVQIPAAILAVEGIRFLRREHVSWRSVFATTAACLTVFGWVGFFGGVAPREGIEFWTPLYPAPMLRATEFIPEQGLYALTGIGAYFVIIEALLFRRRPVPAEMQSWLGVSLVLGLAVLFYLYPPVLLPDHPGGPIGRVARILLPQPDYDWARVALFYVPAILCVLRFARWPREVGFWLVAAAFVLAMKQQVPWEKYLYPTLAVLWTMVALGRLPGYGATPTGGGENGLTKQALPRLGLSR